MLKDYWWKGFATEIGNAIIQYALEKIGVSNLFAGHHPNNIGSKKTLQKLGFHCFGTVFYAPTGLQHPAYYYHSI